ncbi:hypothetical protein GC173_03905 [bacterium]|nr:hypothetical protein [bacterium]
MEKVLANRLSTTALAICFAFSNIFLTGCLAVKVPDTMRKPAQINMAGYEQITVGKIEATLPTARFATEPIRQRLISGIQNTGLYRVYDRDSLEEGMRERELGEYLGGDNTAVSSFQQANVLVTGVIDRVDYSSSVEQKEEYVAENQTRTVYRRVAKTETSLTLKVIDLETFEIAAAATIKESDPMTGEWTYSRPAELDPSQSYDRLFDKVAAQFLKKIAPYTVNVEVVLFDVGPSPHKRNGMRNFKAREYTAAEECFQQGVDILNANPKTSPKTMARAIHNVAVAQEFSGKLDEAAATCDEALSKYMSKETVALKARIRERIKDRDLFAQQGME